MKTWTQVSMSKTNYIRINFWEQILQTFIKQFNWLKNIAKLWICVFKSCHSISYTALDVPHHQKGEQSIDLLWLPPLGETAGRQSLDWIL